MNNNLWFIQSSFLAESAPPPPFSLELSQFDLKVHLLQLPPAGGGGGGMEGGMRTTLLHPSIHAIMGSGDKLYDEGLCGALWVAEGGFDISKEQTRLAYCIWYGIGSHR